MIVVIIAASSLLNFFYTPTVPYDFSKISVASSLVNLYLSQIYGIAFGCPYVIALLVRIFGGLVSVVDVKLLKYSYCAFTGIV